MVAIDLYVNETTRHADVILPPAWTLAEDHVDLLMPNHAVRNVARWCPPVVERKPDERADWEILLEIAERLGGGATGVPVVDRGIRVARRLGMRWTPSATAALLLRLGPHGDRFLPWSSGLNRERLAAAPHGDRPRTARARCRPPRPASGPSRAPRPGADRDGALRARASGLDRAGP